MRIFSIDAFHNATVALVKLHIVWPVQEQVFGPGSIIPNFLEETMTTAEKVLRELEKVTGTNQVQKDLDLALFDEDVLDSFGTVELIVGLSEIFDISISPAEIDRQRWSTPRKIISFIEEKVEI